MINMLEALVEKMDNTHEQVENFSRKMEIIKNNQLEFLTDEKYKTTDLKFSENLRVNTLNEPKILLCKHLETKDKERGH